MSTTNKIAITLGVASGALLAAWLLTGSRKQKTKAFISKSAVGLKRSLKTEKRPRRRVLEDSEGFYI